MKIRVATSALALAFAAISPSAVSAQQAATAPAEVSQSLQVIVAQSEIKSDINASNISAAAGGGLLVALIDAGVESARTKKAEELIAPIRNAVGAIDVDAIAQETAKASFADIGWFKANPVSTFSKDSSPIGKSKALDKMTTPQMAFVEYVYDFSPNFDAIRVVMNYEVAKKEIPATAKGVGEKRVSGKNLVERATAVSIVTIPPMGDNKKETNAPRWVENNGALFRAGIKAAFDGIRLITPRSVNATAEDRKAFNDKTKKKAFAGGLIGRLQPSPDGTTVIWDKMFGRLVIVQLISVYIPSL